MFRYRRMLTLLFVVVVVTATAGKPTNAKLSPGYPIYHPLPLLQRRHNRNHTFVLHARDPVAFHNATRVWRVILSANFRARIRIEALAFPRTFADTFLKPWHTQQTCLQSKWVDQNLGNTFRLTVIYKRGGVYLDLDIISLSTLAVGEVLGRSPAMQDKNAMNNAFLVFLASDEFVWGTMEEFVEEFNGNVWGKNGPEIIARVQEAIVWRWSYVFSGSCPFPILISDPMIRSIAMYWWNRRAKSVEMMANATVLEVVIKEHCPAHFGAQLESAGHRCRYDFGAPELILGDPEFMKPKPSPKSAEKEQKV
ncbi:hypothetical protein BC830DRAFT_1164215 [Chytriomyces sp. MP71]|nr:hypothetical protein BC830DRAFT_1164215 [Chytriomyces sp. MP71]